MIRLISIVSILFAGMAGDATAQATERPEVVVEWKDASKYVDVRAARESQRRFEKRVFEQLGNYIMIESAKLLKKDQRLVVTVHNLDLAGEIEMSVMGPGEDMRVIREPTLTMIDLEYRLVDASDRVLITGRDKMRGNWSYRLGTRSERNRSFIYEKQMISDWLSKKITPKLACLK